jgi:hypothetical protein
VVTFNQTTITCTTPPGAYLQRTVVVLQNGGLISEATGAITLSYLQCASGTYDPAFVPPYILLSGSPCITCDNGLVSTTQGQSSCSSCEKGSFATSSSQCSLCPAGALIFRFSSLALYLVEQCLGSSSLNNMK